MMERWPGLFLFFKYTQNFEYILESILQKNITKMKKVRIYQINQIIIVNSNKNNTGLKHFSKLFHGRKALNGIVTFNWPS